ncbi:MAG TPA: alpha-glucosidase C-terminal domain-containing protein, partial [Anaerolineae bacterium]|nr:alpha-glucosidase C-terminal domain-containing protein [Anaerolineae bacterium]
TPAIPDNCQWCVFLRNHDELTLEMVTEEDRQLMWQLYAPDPRMRLNLGIRRRLAPLLENDRRKIELANSILFTLPGAPIIYYGDEIGMGDNIWLFDRNGVRTPMQWTGEPGAGFSTAALETFYEPLIDDAIYGYHQVNVAAQMADPTSLFHTIKHMVATRKANPVLGEGDYQFLPTGNKAVLAILRQSDDAAILAVHNLTEQNQTAAFDLAEFAGRVPRDLLAPQREPLPEISTVPYTMSLGPFDYFWLGLK